MDPLTIPSPLILVLVLALFIYTLSGFLLLLYRQHISPLRHLRGPHSPSFFFGNLAEMHDQENTDLIADWEAAHGPTFVYRGFIGGCRLMTTDPAAIAHILGHAYDYPKPDFIRDGLATMAAGHDGLLVVEGETHSRQVRRPTSPPPTSPLPSLVYLLMIVSSPITAQNPRAFYFGKSKFHHVHDRLIAPDSSLHTISHQVPRPHFLG